jgi:phosphatidylglycerophosphatase A
VAWADQRFKRRLVDGSPEPIGHRQGFGILFDDLVAALCTLVLMGVWITLTRALWSF